MVWSCFQRNSAKKKSIPRLFLNYLAGALTVLASSPGLKARNRTIEGRKLITFLHFGFILACPLPLTFRWFELWTGGAIPLSDDQLSSSEFILRSNRSLNQKSRHLDSYYCQSCRQVKRLSRVHRMCWASNLKIINSPSKVKHRTKATFTVGQRHDNNSSTVRAVLLLGGHPQMHNRHRTRAAMTVKGLSASEIVSVS